MKYFFSVLLFLFVLSLPAFSEDIYTKIKIDNSNFICTAFECYDTDSFKYDSFNKIYSVDFMYEYHPGDKGDIKCPFDNSYISNFLFNLDLNEKTKKITTDYKGFVCSIDNFGIYNDNPTSNNAVNIYYNNDINLLYPQIKSKKDVSPDFSVPGSFDSIFEDLKYIKKVTSN